MALATVDGKLNFKAERENTKDLAGWGADQPETVSCAWCTTAGTDWTFTGTHAECVTEAAKHRSDRHGVKKTAGKTRPLVSMNGEPLTGRDSHGLTADDRRAIAERSAPQPRGYWTLERIIDAYIVWEHRFGRAPSSVDWARSTGEYPGYNIVTRAVGGWPELRAAVNADRAQRSRVDLPAAGDATVPAEPASPGREISIVPLAQAIEDQRHRIQTKRAELEDTERALPPLIGLLRDRLDVLEETG